LPRASGIGRDVSAQNVRLKRPTPGPEEAENIAAAITKSDGLLRPGDIVVTPLGFLLFKGVAADGYINEFKPAPNPLNQGRAKKY
jgi:hypothetical protein